MSSCCENGYGIGLARMMCVIADLAADTRYVQVRRTQKDPIRTKSTIKRKFTIGNHTAKHLMALHGIQTLDVGLPELLSSTHTLS